MEFAQVSYLVINVLCLHEVAEEQTSNVVVLHSAALRQVTEDLVNAHLVAAFTDVTDVLEKLFPVVPSNRTNVVLAVMRTRPKSQD